MSSVIRTHHGLRHVFSAGGHVDGEGEPDGPQGHGALLPPTPAPGGLPPGHRPPLHVVLLRCRGLLRRQQLGQLAHPGLATGGSRRLKATVCSANMEINMRERESGVYKEGAAVSCFSPNGSIHLLYLIEKKQQSCSDVRVDQKQVKTGGNLVLSTDNSLISE